MDTFGIVNPGQMGVTVAAALAEGGARVLFAGDGRSAATRERAATAGLEDAGSLADLAGRAAMLLSVVPPAAALDVAGSVAALGFTGTYVDANAVSPDTARAIGARVTADGAAFVDGGVIGPPARRRGTTRLYLCGERAPEVAAAFAGSALDARAIDGPIGAASALKNCFASWTKGTSALLLAIRALARAEGVEAALLEEWSMSWPELGQRSERSGADAAAKAWRFVGEMREIAAALEAHGLPGGFGAAPAELYERLTALKDRDTSLDEALALLGVDDDSRAAE